MTDISMNYFSDPEQMEEMVRLKRQGQFLTAGMGGLLAEIDASSLSRVLDLACGPGDWVLDLAMTHPHLHITGIDISETMIEYARAQQDTRQIDNASFERANILLSPLHFPDASFDLINARLMVSFMHTNAWPPLLAECKRLLKPGGFLRLTECEAPMSNCASYERLNSFLVRALHAAGHSFSHDGRVIIVPMLSRLLAEAGFQAIRGVTHPLEFTADTPEYLVDIRAFPLVLPFLLRHQVTTPEAFEALYQQTLIEIQRADFYTLWLLRTVIGQKEARERLPQPGELPGKIA